MYTTMNCDFVEGEYFYIQPTGQGEIQSDNPNSDSLGWLPTFSPIPSHNPTQETNTQGENIQGENIQGENSQPNPCPVIDVGPPERVSSTAGPSNSKLHDEELSDTTEPSTPLSDPEVNSSDDNIIPQNVPNVTDNDRQDENNEVTENIGVDGDTGQYELPKRSTRGVPTRRYSRDWKGRKSKYSVTGIAQGQLTEMARAFETALYEEEEIPSHSKRQ